MTTIDNRIVSMQFENRQFEDGVQTTMSSLDKLKKSLELEKSAQSLSELEKIGDNFQLDGISKAVDTISDKFSMMGIIAITTLMNIVNSAVDAGAALVKSLAIDPPMDGFRKYEDKTTSVQTIMNATGLSIENVNEQLDKLLWFTDETSYNFVDMVNNIGKFTSQGISLETSVTAMQGIANWAALSGQNASTASRAMYNLAQAIGMGKVTGRDWMSIENANMATKEFKTTVIETAKAMQILDKSGKILKGKGKGLIVTAENFSSTLASGWFSSDVLMNSLDKYGNYTNAVYEKVQETGMSAAEAMEVVSDKGMELGKKGLKAAQVAKTFTDAINATRDAVSSGWMRTWEILFGNIEEAMVLWTDFTAVLWDVFASGSEARNELLLAWKELGGRDRLLEGIAAGWEAILAVLEPVKEAFRDIFPPQTAEALYSLTRSFKALMIQIKIGDETADKLRRTFRGFFAAIDIVLMALDALRKSFGRAIRFWFPDYTEGFLSITAPIGDYIVQIRDALKASDFFNETLKKAEKFIKPIGDTLKWFAGKVTDVVSAYLEWVTLEDTIAKVKEFFKPITDSIATINEFLSPTVDAVKEFVSDVVSSLNEFGNASLPGLDSFMDNVKESFKPFEWIGNLITGTIDTVKKLYEKFKPTLKKIGDYLSSAFGELGTNLWTAVSNLDFDAIFDILNGGLLIAILLGIKKFIDRVADILKPSGEIMKSVTGVLDTLRDALKSWQMQLKAVTLLSLANALLQLAIATVILSSIDPDRLATALAGITVLFVNLFATLLLLQKMMGTDKDKFAAISKVAGALIGMAFAILILSWALKSLSSLNVDQLSTGLSGVIVMIFSLAAATKLLASKNSSKEMIGVAFSLVIFSLALHSLAGVVKTLAALDFASMLAGLTIMGITLAGLVIFFDKINMDKIGKSWGISFLALAVSIQILSWALTTLSKLNPTQIQQGLVSMAGIFGILGLFINAVDNKKIFATSLAMNAMAVSLYIFIGAISILGALPVGMLEQGLVGLAATLFIVAAALRIADGKKVLDSAIAISILAAALALLLPTIAILGIMDPTHLAIGLIALAAVMAVLAGALWLLGKAAPAMVGLGWALAGVGAGLAALGLGMTLFAAGLAAIATVGAIGFTGLRVVADVLIYLFERMLASLSIAITKFLDAIILLAPKIGQVVWFVVNEMLKVFLVYLPELVDAFMSFVYLIGEKIPEFAAIGMQAIVAFLYSISSRMYEITMIAADIVLEFINGIADKMSDIVDSAFKLIISFVNGLADAIRKYRGQLYDAAKNILDALTGGITTNIFRIVEPIVSFIWEIVTTFVETIANIWDDIMDIGKNFIEGIIAGITGMGKALLKGAEEVVGNAVEGIKKFLGIKSPSTVGEEIGKFFDMGIAQGIVKFGEDVSTSAEDVGDNAVSAMQKALLKVDDLVSSDMDLTPVITPVIDLTNVKEGISSIDQHFGSKKTLNVDGNIAAAGVVASQIKGPPSKETLDSQAAQAPNITFNQNNYSPKALSRVEIYRQTKNQITSLKGAMTSS